MKLQERLEEINCSVASSSLGWYFKLDGSGHPRSRKDAKFFVELRAGLTTFAAMAYIISVNASILSQTGGTCVCTDEADPTCATDPAYAQCVTAINRDLVTATAAIAAFASFFFGLFANLPLGLAPGMGLNTYFAFNVVGFHGTGLVSYRLALTAVFVEGMIFFGLSLFGMRQWLIRAIPICLKLATGAGIGLYLTLIGLSYSAGIGLIQGTMTDPLTLAGCTVADQDPTTGLCSSAGKMRNPTLWMGILGGIIIAMLLLYRVKASILIGVVLISITSWPRVSPITLFPYTNSGDEAFNFFKQVVAFHKIDNTLNAQQWDLGGIGSQFGLALITFLYVDILDCSGTLLSMARFAGVLDEKTGDFEGSTAAYMTDSLSISIGSLFGCSPVTVFVESGAGIAEGGKTGLTGMITGICFFISIFFAPIFASFPSWATGPALVLIGCSMMTVVPQINWIYAGDAIPAFLTIAIMPFTYSISYGLIAGVFSYIVLNGGAWVIKVISRGKILPPNYDTQVHWTYKIPGGIMPPWISRMIHGKRKFWAEDIDIEGREKINTSDVSSTKAPAHASAVQESAQAEIMKG